MNISEYITLGLAIIGGASLILKYVAPLTKNRIDDKVYHILEEILKAVSFDKDKKILSLWGDSKDAIKIKIKR
jgi:hypothetical protein